MPPASLSTFAVINPGPTTAKMSRIRVFQLLSHLIGHAHTVFQPDFCRINENRKEGQQLPERISSRHKKAPAFSFEKAGAAGLEDQFRADLKLPGIEGSTRYTHLPAGSGDAITKVLRLRAYEIGRAID